MHEYLFFPFRADGVALSFEAMRLGSDDEASTRAARVMEDHDSAALVVVWRGDRLVLRLDRRIAVPPPVECA